MSNVMKIMGVEGDTKLIWDPDNKDEVASAQKTFDDLKGKHFTAFSVKANGKAGEVLEKFDPKEEKIIMVPRMAGG